VAADGWCAPKKKQTEKIVIVVVNWLSFMWFYFVSKKFQEINSGIVIIFKTNSFIFGFIFLSIDQHLDLDNRSDCIRSPQLSG